MESSLGGLSAPKPKKKKIELRGGGQESFGRQGSFRVLKIHWIDSSKLANKHAMPSSPSKSAGGPSTNAAAALKQLRIQTGVVRRLVKEVRMYELEVAGLQASLEKLKADAPPQDSEKECLLRHRQEVLRESQMMVPDTERRLQAARDKLAELLKQHEAVCFQDPVFLEAAEEFGKLQQQPKKEQGDCSDM